NGLRSGTGAGPAARDSSDLLFGHLYDQPVQVVRDLELAGQTRAHRVGVPGEIEHVLFHRILWRQAVHPFVIHIDMAGRARTGAAAIGLDAGDVVIPRAFHDGQAGGNVDDMPV